MILWSRGEDEDEDDAVVVDLCDSLPVLLSELLLPLRFVTRSEEVDDP